MNYQLKGLNQIPYIEILPGDGCLERESDALDLVAICGEHRAPRLLLHEENLHDDFFDLKTGLAGAAMLKWGNYQVKVALVLTPERASSGRFGEMVLEANRSNRLLHVFSEGAEAVEWLVRG
jgi:PadR family transcriptional regulator, regulatory protein AphA